MSSASPRQSRAKNAHSRAKTLLLTGFEPFADDPGGLHLNPSAEVALGLHGQRIGAWRIAGHVLPCEYGRSVRSLRQLLREYQPEAVICLGQAGGRSAISIERVAINWDEAALADNAGQVRAGQAILKTAPAAYFSTLPIHAMRDALAMQGLPSELSSTAGHFVCNHVFFSLLHGLRKANTPAGFIHLPYLPQQAGAGVPALPLASMMQGIEVAISAL